MKNFTGNKMRKEVMRRSLTQSLTGVEFINNSPNISGLLRFLNADRGNIGSWLDYPRRRYSGHKLTEFIMVYQRNKLRHVNARSSGPHAHRQFVAKESCSAAVHARHAEVFANQRRGDYVKLLERNNAIQLRLTGQQAYQLNEEIRVSVIRQGDEVSKALARPVFPECLLFGDQNYVAPVALALADEVSTFKICSEAYHIQRARF